MKGNEMGGSSWCCGFKSNKHSFFHSFFKVSSFLSKNDTKLLVTNNRYQSNLAAARMGAERQVESYVQPARGSMVTMIRSKEFFDMVETGYSEPNEGEVLSAGQQQRLAASKLKDRQELFISVH